MCRRRSSSLSTAGTRKRQSRAQRQALPWDRSTHKWWAPCPPCWSSPGHCNREEISQLSSRGGLRIYSESCLNLVAHEVFGVPCCHFGRYVNPGFPVGAKSEACGRAKDNVPHENWPNRSFWITAPGLLRLTGLDLTQAGHHSGRRDDRKQTWMKHEWNRK